MITIKEFRIVTLTLSLLALLTTIGRLVDRIYRRKLWWDDAWVFLASIFCIITAVASWLHTTPFQFEGVKVAIYYLVAEGFYATNWSARMSILFTIIRLTLDRSPLRRALYGSAGVFLVVWLILSAQAGWVCEKDPTWKDKVIAQCMLGENVAIAQIICDVVTDALLIFAPLKLLWRVKISRAQKIRLVTVFSATIVTTAVSLAHAYYVLRVGGLEEGVAATVQYTVSMIVANLTVLVALFFRLSGDDASSKMSVPMVSTLKFKSRDMGAAKSQSESDTVMEIGLGHSETTLKNSVDSTKKVQGHGQLEVDSQYKLTV